MRLEHWLLFLQGFLASLTESRPASANLLEGRNAYKTQLTYGENEEDFVPPKVSKSLISDFTDPATGFNPYLDLSEGPTDFVRMQNVSDSAGFEYKYYKYEGSKERHTKRDNPPRRTWAKPNPNIPPPEGLLDSAERSKPSRYQRVPQPQRLSDQGEKRRESILDTRQNNFASLVEGESSGRRDFWTTSTKPSGEELIEHNVKIEVESVSTEQPDSKMDYVTVLSESTKRVKATMESVLEIGTTILSNSVAEDGQQPSATDEEKEETKPPIATFLETKSFLYSLALICASVVFFAALLTGMFIYRRKRRRLPGVHKKGGRFFFSARVKNRGVGQAFRAKEERILPDDFRVTVC